METGNLVRSKIRKEGYLEMLQRRIGKWSRSNLVTILPTITLFYTKLKTSG
jgi:hypothetical protein